MSATRPASGDARPLSAVLSELGRQWRRQASTLAGLSLPEALSRCLNPEQRSQVGFGGLRRGVLTLTVDSAALLGELSGFKRHTLLEALRSTPEGARVRTLRIVSAGADDGG